MTWDGRKGTGGGGGGGGTVESIVEGDNITVDDTDPANPEVSAHITIYQTIPFKFLGSIGVGVGQTKLPNNTPHTRTLTSVQMLVEDAPSGGVVTGDVNLEGTTIFTTQANRPQITAGNLASSIVTAIDVTTWAPGEDLSCDIDAYTAPASNLQFLITYRITL